MEKYPPQENQQTKDIMVFSEKAYIALKNVVFGEHLHYWTSFFATSTISFKAWMTPVSFLYFCLTTHGCANCTRIFLSSDKMEKIKASDESYFAATILQAHEIFGYKQHFFTYNQVADFFEKCKEKSYWPTNYKGCQELFTETEIKRFIRCYRNLDFGLLESASNFVLLRPHDKNEEKDIEEEDIEEENIEEEDIEIFVSDVDLYGDFLKLAKDSPVENTNIILSPSVVESYRKLQKLFEVSIGKYPDSVIRSDYFLSSSQ